MTFFIHQPTSANEMQVVRALFEQYGEAIGVDLASQNFAQELADLPGKYAPPAGCILVATVDGQPAGCVALRALSDGACEMKRLYVRPQHRADGLGRKLAQRIIEEARARGYACMRLDTIPAKMRGAVSLYLALGFDWIPAYWSNPLPGAQYMELKLQRASRSAD
jgi:ribosomal protein S18 acetylase RimI-like enzyme